MSISFFCACEKPEALSSRGPMNIHGLEGKATRASEAVPEDLASAGEKSYREALEHRLHLDAGVFLDAAAGFDIDLITGVEGNLKGVSVAVQPGDAFTLAAGEVVDEKSRGAEKNVVGTFDAPEAVFQAFRSGQELALAEGDGLPLRKMKSEHMPCSIAAEGDSPGAALPSGKPGCRPPCA